MPLVRLHQRLFAILLLASMALATRFRFSIQEIHVNNTRDVSEDDLVLAIAATTGSGTVNSTFTLGSAEEGRTIRWNNLTQEIDVPASASNLSVALGVINAGDEDQKTTLDFVQGIVNVASKFPGPQATSVDILSIALGVLGSLLDCTGPVVVGNALYTKDTLDRFDQSQPVCQTKDYIYDSPKITCGIDGPNYTVTYCIERLDAKGTSSAGGLVPQGLWVGLGWVIAVGFSVGFL